MQEINSFSGFDKKYLSIFNHVPIALLIEDFSEAMTYLKSIAPTETNLVETFLKSNPDELFKIASLVKIKEVNAKALALYGVTSKGELLRNLDKLFSYKSVDGYSKLIANVFLRKPNSPIHSYNKTITGDQLIISVNYQIMEGDEDLLENVIVSIENITEKEQAFQKLTDSKNLLAKTLTNINDGLVILDKNSNYQYLNEKAATLLGRKTTDLIGKNLWNEFSETEGDLFFDNFHKARETNHSISFENYYKPLNVWFENKIIPLKEGVLIFFREINSKKEKEEQIHTAYNIINKSSSVAFLMKNDYNFPVVFASKNAEKIFEYSYKEFLNNTIKISDVVLPEDLEIIRSRFFSLAKNNTITQFISEPFRIITKTGNIKWIEVNFDSILNSNNEITHIQGIAHDITNRIETEHKLFESSQQLQYQFNNTPLASIIWDLDFKVLKWNNTATKIFGYTEEEAKKMSDSDFLTPPNLIPFMRNKVLSKFWTHKEGFKNTNENIRKNGEIIICDWYNIAIRDAKGNITGMASFADDITEKIRAKRLLEISEKKYRDVFEKSFDAKLLIKNGRFIDCNQSTLTLFGFNSKEEIINLHPSKISPKQQPSGEDSFILAEKMMNIAIEKEIHRFKWYHTRKNGQVFPAEVTLTALKENGIVDVIYTRIKDITSQVRKEGLESVIYNISKAALTIANFNDFGLFIRNELQKVIETNNFFIALYNKETDIISTPVFIDEKEDIEDFSAEKSLTGYVIKTKKSLILNKKAHQKLIKDGIVNLVGEPSEKWVGVPLKVNDEVIGAIVVQSYVNENAYTEDDVKLLEFVSSQISIIISKKKNEKDLQLALAKAQESDRLKTSFLANMSHEIRTPMNGIIGFSELLLKPDLDFAKRELYARVVIKSGQRLLSIINDILDISKIESGIVKLKLEQVNLNKLIDELILFFKPNAHEKNIQLLTHKELDNTHCNVELDKTKIYQIFTNLISNSLKYTQKGSVEFGYTVKENQLEFYVKDTGIGIDKKLQPSIFDRFVQEENQLNISNKGTGLGLAISKKLIDLWHGKLWLSSDKNGTTIYFTTPFKMAKPVEISTVINTNNWQTTMKNSETTILFAEDEEFNRMYITELFTNSKIKILEAVNGKKAIEMTRLHPEIKMVFMDLKMPVMDGKTAMLEIKKEKPKLPVIVLSAFAMESDIERAKNDGFDDYLIKPIDKDKLLALIHKYQK